MTTSKTTATMNTVVTPKEGDDMFIAFTMPDQSVITTVEALGNMLTITLGQCRNNYTARKVLEKSSMIARVSDSISGQSEKVTESPTTTVILNVGDAKIAIMALEEMLKRVLNAGKPDTPCDTLRQAKEVAKVSDDFERQIKWAQASPPKEEEQIVVPSASAEVEVTTDAVA